MALAQTASSARLEEIIVTATRRELNLQDVSQNVTAFTTEDIEKQAFQETWRVDRCESCGHGFVANLPTLQRLEEIYNSDVHAPNFDASRVTAQTLEDRPGADAWAREIASLDPLYRTAS